MKIKIRLQNLYTLLKKFEWRPFLVGLGYYVVLGQITHYLPNPMLEDASLAINMVIPVIAGYCRGSLVGGLVGGVGTLLNLLLKVPLHGWDYYELVAILPHAMMGIAAGWSQVSRSHISTAFTIIIGHSLNLIFFLLTGLLSLEVVLQSVFWTGLVMEVLVDLIIIMLYLEFIEFRQGTKLTFAWQRMGWVQFTLLLSMGIAVWGLLIVGYLEGVDFIGYVLVLPIIIMVPTLGFVESWLMTFLTSVLLLWQGVEWQNLYGSPEVALILVLNVVVLAMGNLVNNWHTQRRLAELRLVELGRAYNILTETNELREQMIQNISHELRTPLSMVIGYSELLENETWGEMSAEQKRAAHVIWKNGKGLSEIVKQVTALEEVGIGQMTHHPTSLNSLLRIAVAARQENLLAKYTLRLQLPEDVLNLSGDVQYLRLAIDALVDNALKFSPDGGTITIKLWAEKNKIYLAVRDEGIGISDQYQKHLFEYFYQVDGSTTRQFGGLGTGLALVKAVAIAHGGDTWVKSELGKGSTFGFWVPYRLQLGKASQ